MGLADKRNCVKLENNLSHWADFIKINFIVCTVLLSVTVPLWWGIVCKKLPMGISAIITGNLKNIECHQSYAKRLLLL